MNKRYKMELYIKSTRPRENEVEFRFKRINKTNFNILRDEFMKLPQWKYELQSDVTMSGVARIISEFPKEIRCVKGVSTIFHTKTRIQRPYESQDFRISEAREELVTGIDDSSFQFMYNVTHKRTRKRHSFSNGNYIFDLTQVYTDGCNTPTYEAELEILDVDLFLTSTVHKILSLIKNGFNVQSEFMDIVRSNRFVGPLPYTLTREKFEDGVLTCGYSVTDKADGERFLMFFNSNGLVFLVDRNNDMTYCGTTSPIITNTIIDGELINGVFHGFDALFDESKDIREYDLIKRLKILGRIINKCKNVEQIKMQTKAFYMKLNGEFCRIQNGNVKKHPGILNGHIGSISKQLWKRKDKLFKYKLDGLIFTPILKGYYNHDIYKWKPVDTIDFFVRKEKPGRWKLYIAGNDKDVYKNLPFFGIGDGRFIIKKGKITETVSNKIYKDDTLSEFLRNGIINIDKTIDNSFSDESVVEFYYEPTEQNFVPMKVREDKTFANNVLTINDVWESLKSPITIDDISSSPYRMAVRPFHNKIKTNLISKYMHRKSVLDIGFGAGGDIHKYSKARVKSVIGIDIVEPEYHIPSFIKFIKVSGDDYCIKNILEQKRYQTKFDVINIQFAAHYFFRNTEVLDNFIKNLNDCIKPGGKIVMTVLDGNKVRNLLQNGGGYGTNGGQNIYEMNMNGEQLNVKLHGTSYFDGFTSNEYIINIDSFVSKMNDNSFSLIEKKGFEKFSNDEDFKTHIGIMCDAEMEYSFLNTILVFEK